jgi:hypothetical protein
MIGTTFKPHHLLTKTTCKQRPVWISSNQFWLINLQIATTSSQLPLLWGPLGGRCTQMWLSFKIHLKSKICIFLKIQNENFDWNYFKTFFKSKIYILESTNKYLSKNLQFVSVSGWKIIILNAFVDKWNTAV